MSARGVSAAIFVDLHKAYSGNRRHACIRYLAALAPNHMDTIAYLVNWVVSNKARIVIGIRFLSVISMCGFDGCLE